MKSILSYRSLMRGAALAGCIAAGTALADTAEQIINRGNEYWAENKLELAEQQYRQAIALAPDSLVAHQRLASLYLARNKNREAIEAYQAAIILQPDNPSLFAGICLAYLHEGSYSASQAMCSRANELDPGLESARQLTAYINARLEVENGRP